MAKKKCVIFLGSHPNDNNTTVLQKLRRPCSAVWKQHMLAAGNVCDSAFPDAVGGTDVMRAARDWSLRRLGLMPGRREQYSAEKKHEVIHTRSQMCRRAAWPGRSWEKGGNLGNGENNNNVLVTFGSENGTYTFMFMNLSDTFIQSSSMIEHRGAETVCPAHSCIVYICY